MFEGTPKAEIPELEWGQYLIDMLSEIGFARSGSAGAVPVSYAEIESWQRMTRAEVPSHEAVMLRQLSSAYCSQLVEAGKPDCPRPDQTGPHDTEKRGKVANAFKSLVKAYKGKN